MKRIVPCLFFRFILPVVLLISSVIRPCLFSLVYGVMLLVWPFMESFSEAGTPAGTRKYLILCSTFATVMALAQGIFQSVMSAVPEFRDEIMPCQHLEPLLRFVGLTLVTHASIGHAIRLLVPDFLTYLTLVITLTLSEVYNRSFAAAREDLSDMESPPYQRQVQPTSENVPLLKSITGYKPFLKAVKAFSNLLVVVLLCLVGIAWPSLLSALYFVTFLVFASLWAFGRVKRCFVASLVKTLLVCYVAVHLITLYMYQMWPFQTDVPSSSVTARLIGLTPILTTNCTDVWAVHIVARDPAVFGNVILLFVFYMHLAFQLHYMDKVDVDAGNATDIVAEDQRGVHTDSASSIHEDLLHFNEGEAGPAHAELPHDDQNLDGGSSRVPAEEKPSPPKPADIYSYCPFLVDVYAFCIRHAYVASLLVMMAWAITYHSWLSFVWLLLACIVWMCTNSRRTFFFLSPFIVFYAEVLLLLQFIYSLNLTNGELPDELPDVPLQQIGLIKPMGPAWIPLLVKVLYSCPFWASMRFFSYELKPPPPEGSLALPGGITVYGTFPDEDARTRSSWLERFMAKYWIYVVGLVLLLISLRRPVFLYNIGYMVFFVLLLTVLHVSFPFWRRFLFVYWMVLTAYSIVVLWLVYTYQFHGVPQMWRNWTNWSDDTFMDLGLYTYDSGSLFVQLLTPISFLVVVILQLKFFHSGFLKATDPSYQYAPIRNAPNVDEKSTRLRWLKTLNEGCRRFMELVWRFAEIHSMKLVAVFAMCLTVSEVCAVNFIYPLALSLLFPLPWLHGLLCFVLAFWTSCVIVAKMLFQMRFANATAISMAVTNCSMENNETISFIGDPALYTGFEKVINIGYYLKNYVALLVILVLHVIIRERQKYKRLSKKLAEVEESIIFPLVSRKQADEGLCQCAKYFANYFFYKFGVEICFIAIVVDIGVRMDAVAFMYVVFLLLFLTVRRRVLGGIWYLFTLFMAIIIPVQYAICIGLPPNLCIAYPWIWTLSPQLAAWLFLPSYVDPPNAVHLMADFIVFLVALCQLKVFRIEQRSNTLSYPGGSNFPIDRHTRKTVNPVPDFVTNCVSPLDIAKNVIFRYFHWFTIASVFVAGVGGSSIFALGYLIAAFYILWKDNELYIHRTAVAIRKWYCLIFYIVFVIAVKVALQIVGCVYFRAVCYTFPSLIQLFSIACVRDIAEFSDIITRECHVSRNDADILYDSICFAFLIIQIRILGTWYFQHAAFAFQLEHFFSARGAILIDDLILKRMKTQQEKEQQIVEKIQRTAQTIRDTYLKTVEGKTVFEPTTYGQAKRAGDYYMFDYDVEVDVVDTTRIEEEKFEDVSEGPAATLGPAQMIHRAAETDMTLEEIAEGRPISVVKSETTDVTAPELGSKATSSDKFVGATKFVVKLLSNGLRWLGNVFDSWSADYRFVAHVLQTEKKTLSRSLPEERYPDREVQEIQHIVTQSELGRLMYRPPSEDSILQTEQALKESKRKRNNLMQFLAATYYLLIANTETICFVAVVVNQMLNASLLSLPLPLLVFFWGTLCSPRPSKTFWIILIAYVEYMIVVKFFFQFGLFPWNQRLASLKDPFYLPRIIGIEKRRFFAMPDVTLLMLLFFHRYHLKSLGIWKRSTSVRRDWFKGAPPKVEDQVAQISKLDTFELQDLMTKSVTAKPGHSSDDATEKPSSEEEEQSRCPACLRPVIRFYRRIVEPPFRYIIDLYRFLFLCDLICFLISAFGYSSFGVETGKGDVITDIRSNKVPLPFVLILITLMILMIVDRGIYLRKNVVAKLVFQYLLVIGVHAWIFFGLPAITDRAIMYNRTAKFWYFVKCIYFLLSACQIRNGYPSRVLGNLLTKRYGLVNYVLFLVYRATPFLFELRTVIDWIWTDTCMPLFDFFNMENIFSCIFLAKCARKFEKDYPVPRGQPKTLLVKYGMGLSILLIIVVLLWLPLLLFSLVNAIGERALPYQVHCRISLEGYPDLYSMDAQASYLQTFTAGEYADFQDIFYKKQAVSFLRDYSHEDCQRVVLRNSSKNIWSISPPSRQALMRELSGTSMMRLNTELEFVRMVPSASASSTVQLYRKSLKLPSGSPVREGFIQVINGSEENSAVIVTSAIPYIVVVPSIGKVHPAQTLLDSLPFATGENPGFVNLSLTLGHSGTGPEMIEWWKLTMITPPWMPRSSGKEQPLTMVSFVDKVFPSALNAITSGGIIGVYVVVVLAAGRFIRGLVVTSPLQVIITEMPNVDGLLNLCLDIFLVREARDFILELDLFAKLIFLFRSPETLIRYSKQKLE